MCKFLITREEPNNYLTRHDCSDLRTTDDISGFVQKWRFALRKPLFYPLNYGD